MKNYSVVYVEHDYPIKVSTIYAKDGEEAAEVVMTAPYRKIIAVSELSEIDEEKPARKSSEIFNLLNKLHKEYYEHAYTEQVLYIDVIAMFYSRLISIGEFTANDIRRIIE